MALKISIVIHQPGTRAAKDRFGVALMSALTEFDSGVEVSTEDSDTPAPRHEAGIGFLQNFFGMEFDEACATFNQLEDKRVSKLMVAKS